MVPTTSGVNASSAPVSPGGELCPTDNLAEKIAKTTAYGLIVLIGCAGNALICFLFFKNKNLRKTVNYFICNMAVSDLLVPIFVVPKEITNIWVKNGAWLVEGSMGLALCKLSHFAQDVSFLVSILSLLFMAFERFIAIVFPMQIAWFGSRVRQTLLALTWITAMVVHAPYFYTFRLGKNDMNATACVSSWEPAFDQASTQREYGITTFTTFVMVPFGLLAAFYTSIGIALRRQNASLTKLACEGIHERTRREKENRKVTILSAVIMAGFILSYVPFNVFVFVYIFGLKLPDSTPCGYLAFLFTANFLAKAASVVNPCTCFVFYRSYRASFKRAVFSVSQPDHWCKGRKLRRPNNELNNRRERRNSGLGLIAQEMTTTQIVTAC